MAETAEIEIKASQWRQVEVGRVVLFTHGQYTGRLAAIVEIIDHKRVRLENHPSNHLRWPDFGNRYWWTDHLRKRTQLSLVNPSPLTTLSSLQSSLRSYHEQLGEVQSRGHGRRQRLRRSGMRVPGQRGGNRGKRDAIYQTLIDSRS